MSPPNARRHCGHGRAHEPVPPPCPPTPSIRDASARNRQHRASPRSSPRRSKVAWALVGDPARILGPASGRAVLPPCPTRGLCDGRQHARVGDRTFVAGRFRARERLREAGPRLFEAAVGIERAAEVGKNRPGAPDRPEGSNVDGTAQQVHGSGNVRPFERPATGGDQSLRSPSGDVACSLIVRCQFVAISGCLLEVVADELLDLRCAGRRP